MADETPQTETTSTVKEIDVKGYKFTVDTDLLDDVDSLEYIERI
jgi:Cu/Ag efflux protein CusF